MVVLDASAILAFLQGEPGADEVEHAMAEGACCGAANWSEVAQRFRAAGRDWGLASALVVSYGVSVEPVTADDAEVAAEMWEAGSGLSLGDRLCLAVAHRLEVDALTADRAWGERPGVRQIR